MTTARFEERQGAEPIETSAGPRYPHAAAPREFLALLLTAARGGLVNQPVEEQSASASPAAAAARFELSVQFDLGTQRLPLDELQSLQAGYVFELAGDAARPVTLRVNGMAIGRGELVRVDGALGVRVLEVQVDARQPA